VLVVSTPAGAVEARSELPDVPIVMGDPTDDEIMMAAGIERAAGVVACSESDNENVVITLTARQLNARVRIVSRLQDVEQESKIRKVGANGVVSPQHIGGLRLASELIRPTVVTFLDTMLRDRDLNLRIDEIIVPEGSSAVGQEIRKLGLADLPGILLLALRSGDGSWEYNPSRSHVVRPGTVLIFLGSPEDSRALRERLGRDVKPSAATEA
jgi:voltage-gated potassium channel